MTRMAFSGAHGVGKSTLIAEIHRALPDYSIVAEPYHALLDEGHVFSDRPSTDDFILQLEHSIATLASDRSGNVLYDRCPADFLAYLGSLGAHDVIQEWFAGARDAMRTLDLVVLVPIERPDRIGTSGGASRLRRLVDERLHQLLLEDGLDFGGTVVEVSGYPEERAIQVMQAVQSL